MQTLMEDMQVSEECRYDHLRDFSDLSCWLDAYFIFQAVQFMSKGSDWERIEYCCVSTFMLDSVNPGSRREPHLHKRHVEGVFSILPALATSTTVENRYICTYIYIYLCIVLQVFC